MMSRIEKLRRRIERQGKHLSRLESARAAEALPGPDWWRAIVKEWRGEEIFKDEPDYQTALERFMIRLPDAELIRILGLHRDSCDELDLNGETSLTASSTSTEPPHGHARERD